METEKPYSEMTSEERLDEILGAFYTLKITRPPEENVNTGVSMQDIYEIGKWENVSTDAPSYESILMDDGLIESVVPGLNMVLRITDKGVNFYLKGGYIQAAAEKEKAEKKHDLETALIRSTLNINYWNKFGIAISIIISLISLIISIFALIK